MRRARPNGLRGLAPTELVSHYNFKDHRCYAELAYDSSESPEGTGPTFHMELLVDVDDNNRRGVLRTDVGKDVTVSECMLSGAICKTFSEWDELTKPFMEQ